MALSIGTVLLCLWFLVLKTGKENANIIGNSSSSSRLLVVVVVVVVVENK